VEFMADMATDTYTAVLNVIELESRGKKEASHHGSAGELGEVDRAVRWRVGASLLATVKGDDAEDGAKLETYREQPD
jgi:hypothetical protein